MASAYSKRLAKLEELLASKVNRPLAYLWLNDGETREECCIRAGYDPSQIDRVRFCRWLDPALDEIRPEYTWDQVNEPGPCDAKPTDGVTQMSPHPGAGQTVTGDAQRSEAGATPAAREPDFEAENRYREAIERRERKMIQEKLDAAAKAFAKSIC